MFRRAERLPGGDTTAWDRLAVGAVAIGVGLPIVVASVSVMGRHWFPSADDAFIFRRVADVGGAHTPLVGVYSRYGWHHPGPLLFWLLAPFERLGGSSGLLIGAAAINLACLAGALATAFRRGGAALVTWVGLLVAVFVHALGSTLLIDPWNPWLPVTGLVWFFLLAWSVGCGDSTMWPWLIGVGSWEVQAHVGFAPVVGALLAMAFVLGRGWRFSWRGAWRPAVAVGLVAWAGPLIQQAAGHPGNVQAIVSYAHHPSQSTQGWARALGVAGRQLAIPPPWITGRESNFIGILSTASVETGTGELALLVLLGFLAWRRGRRESALLAATAVVAVMAGLAGLARITGLPFPYLARWMWVVALFVPLAAGWCLAGAVRVRPSVRTGILMLVASAAAVVGVTTAAIDSTPDLPGQPFSDGLTAIVPVTQRVLDRGHAYAIEANEAHVLGPGLGVGLQAALEARHYRAYLGPDSVLEAGAWRTTLHRRVDATISVVSPVDPLIPFEPPAGWRLVAHWDPLTPPERARASFLEQQVRGAVGVGSATAVDVTAPVPYAEFRAHGASVADLSELRRLQQQGGVYDVYLHDPAANGPLA